MGVHAVEHGEAAIIVIEVGTHVFIRRDEEVVEGANVDGVAEQLAQHGRVLGEQRLEDGFGFVIASLEALVHACEDSHTQERVLLPRDVVWVAAMHEVETAAKEAAHEFIREHPLPNALWTLADHGDGHVQLRVGHANSTPEDQIIKALLAAAAE